MSALLDQFIRRGSLMMVMGLLFFSGCVSLVRTPGVVIHRQSKKPDIYRGIYHVHTIYSRDSKADLNEVVSSARKNDLDFVVVTDHNNRDGAEVYETESFPEKPLLIIGEEITAPDGHFTSIGVSQDTPRGLSSQEIIDWVHEQGGFIFIAHPFSHRNPWRDWDIKRFDGLEVYNFAHTLYSNHKAILPFKMTLLQGGLFLRSVYANPERELLAWDSLSRKRHVVAVAAVDAHMHQEWFGFDPENYALQFQAATLHVMAQNLTEASIVSGIGLGHSFIVMEFLGKASDFLFKIENGAGDFTIGDKVPLTRTTFATVEVPKKAQIRLYRDGGLIHAEKTRELLYQITQSGTYRVEAYRGGKLWIISNTIYVE